MGTRRLMKPLHTFEHFLVGIAICRSLGQGRATLIQLDFIDLHTGYRDVTFVVYTIADSLTQKLNNFVECQAHPKDH